MNIYNLYQNYIIPKQKDSNVLYSPALDGTEQITTLTGKQTPVIVDRSLYNNKNACGYLTEGWDNSGLWKLSFDAYCSNSYTTSYYAGIVIIKKGELLRDNNVLNIVPVFSLYLYQNGSLTYENMTLRNQGCNYYQKWTTIEVEKISSSSVVMTVDNKSVTLTNMSSLLSNERLCIGVDSWSTNMGVYVKNIIVTKV
jgi:hypothetical protein